MTRADRLASTRVRPRSTALQGATSMETTTSWRWAGLWARRSTPIILGALVCLVLAPVEGWARSATIARIAIQAEDPAQQNQLGDALVSINSDGDLDVIGLQRAVPSGSRISFFRDPGRLLPTGESSTATPAGAFPGAGEGSAVVVNPQGLIGGLHMTIRTLNNIVILARISAGVGADGELTSDNARENPVRKVPIVAPANVWLPTAELVLTQRIRSGELVDVFEGLKGAIPPHSTVGIAYQTFLPEPDRIRWVTVATRNSSYLAPGGTGFTSTGRFGSVAIPDQNSQNITIDGVGTLDGVLRLIVTMPDGTSYEATAQNDVSADLVIDPIVDGTHNNNVADPASGFPFTSTLGRIDGSLGANEVIGGFVNSGDDVFRFQGGSTFSLGITPFGELETRLSSISVSYTDSFGNVSGQTAAIDTTSNLYSAVGAEAVDDAAIAGTLSGVAEPGSSVVVKATVFNGVVEANPVTIAVVQADTTTGAFSTNITNSPSVTVNAVDRAGNESGVQTVDIDTVAHLTTATGVERDGGIAGVLSGTAEPGASVIVKSTNFGGEVEPNPVTIDILGPLPASGAFELNIPSSPFVTVEVVDLAGNISASQRVDIDVVAADPVITELSLVAALQTDGTVDYTFTGAGEPDSTIEVIGAATDFTPLEGVSTNDSFVELPFGDREVGVRATVDTAADGAFTITLPAVRDETLVLQLNDIAGNKSQFIAAVMDVPPAATINLAVTNFPRGSVDQLTITVTTENGDPVDGLFVNLFEDADFLANDGSVARPITDVNYWETGFDGVGTGSVSVDIPEYFPDAETFTNETFVTEGIVHVITRNGAPIGLTDITGLDRVGPRIGVSIIPDVDLQLIERGEHDSDVINILNILPASAGAPKSVPADAVPFVVILTDGNSDGVIDVNDANITRIALAGFNALISQQAGFAIPGVDNIDLGENYWNASAGSVAGFEEVFIALIDANFNYSVDPIPVVLDVRIDDPDVNLITVESDRVSGRAGAAEAESTVSAYANSALSDFLGLAAVDETGAFEVSFNRDDVRALYVTATDGAGNISNPVNLSAIFDVPVTFVVVDGYGLFHTSDGTLTAAPRSSDLIEAAAPIPGANGSFYILDALGAISNYLLAAPTGGVPPAMNGLGLTADLARDLEVTSVEGGLASGYVLLGQGLVMPIGNAPFLGDIEGEELTRVTQPNGRILIDANENGVYDSEDANGNGKLDIEVVQIGGVWQLVTEDLNGNGQLDQEVIIDPNDPSLGFQFSDAARDLEVARNSSGEVVGYVLLDNFGVLHTYGEVGSPDGPPLQNNRVDFAFSYRALELVTNEENAVVDFVALRGSGMVLGLPGGPLGAPPVGDGQGNPRGDSGDLSDPLGIELPYFGFDIMRDIEVNPADISGNGATSDGSDGYYILDGFGGIHAIGGAPALENAPFLGFDIARDLELVTK